MITRPANLQKPRGAALMAVLWLIAILSLACMATLRVISFDMEIASAKIHGSRARQLAEMGIAVGSSQAVKPSDPLLHRANEEMGEGFNVKIISEAGRFNINSVVRTDKPLLLSIFCGWGMEPDVAGKVVDALADWVDADDDESLNGAEEKYYEGEGRINQPFNRPFYDINEVSLVRGMDLVEALHPDWRDWFTVWGNAPAGQNSAETGLDLREAPAELIAAAAEVPVEQAELIPQRVRGADNVLNTEDDDLSLNKEAALSLIGIQGDPNNRFTFSDPNNPTGAGTTRIESIGYTEGAKHKITVIVQNRSANPIKLLERTEEIIP